MLLPNKTSAAAIVVGIAVALIRTSLNQQQHDTGSILGDVLLWPLCQWFRLDACTESFWIKWQDNELFNIEKNNNNGNDMPLLKINEINVQQHLDDEKDFKGVLEDKFGPDWIRKPLLFRQLWTADELSRPNQTLSLEGLLKEHDVEIPYFHNTTDPNMLSPNAVGSIASILSDMTNNDNNIHYHKIGSQLFFREKPHLIRELVPTSLMTSIFGDYFQPHHIRPAPSFLPPQTAVPLFVAQSTTTKDDAPVTVTNLHCEPIGNVAVQLHGSKTWTLISPQYSRQLQPQISKDARAFFYSNAAAMNNGTSSSFLENVCRRVPHYRVVTRAGDALWVPTWTWHRVEHSTSTKEESSANLSIAASVFHFRQWDFFRNNPLFAFTIIPYLVGEFLGISSQ